MGETEDERTSQAGQLFENFVQASTCKGTMQAFCILCRQLELDPSNYTDFYHSLKSAVTSWKAKGLWSKLDKRASHKEYMKGKACTDTKCLVIGSGPCGLRTAIELAFLGAKVVVIEKRDTFSRNNVLHLWPYTIHDLRGLGAKKFYGKFCAGSIDHISIRQLQLMLLKIALIVGVEVHVNVEFIKLLEPPEDQPNEGPGWRAEIRPAGHPISDFDFDVVVGADGRRSTLDGFRRKEFRGKLAIAITANFVNRNTTAEAKVEEISGVAFIFNQKFFLDLKEETGIDLENIVYYKDNTHYFVMTAKKQSLLDKGVIIHDYIETERLLSSQNVDQEALLSYAREAADFGTNYQLPSLDYAINHYGQPDVAMFDFTCMYASENAALVRENFRHQLLVALVGDSLLEPFWPMGTGCARGFLAAFDTAWMVRGWAQGRAPLEILAERESIYRLLPQTTPENINKNFDQYTIDPSTRYPNLNANCVRPHQVSSIFNVCPHLCARSADSDVAFFSQELEIRPRQLLSWCQKQTQGYRGVEVTDLTSSWKSGLALCALIHSYRPDLIDFDSLNEADSSRNNQLAFDVAEREFGIQPVTTGAEIAAEREPDKLLMVLYLSKFYEIFYATAVPAAGKLSIPGKISWLVPSQSAAPPAEGGNARENKVRSMATQLLAKFEENAASGEQRRQVGSKEFPQNLGGSDICSFCQKRVYVMERLSAEGHFFHRECFRCSICRCTLRLGGHAFDSEQGKFYCKMHFSQAKVKSKTRRRTVITFDWALLTALILQLLFFNQNFSYRATPQVHRVPFLGCAGLCVSPGPWLGRHAGWATGCVGRRTRLYSTCAITLLYITVIQLQIVLVSMLVCLCIQPQRSSVERQRKRQEKLVQQQARREQLKRLHRAQVIQRQLEEVEEKQRALEEKGVALEKILRGETGDQSSDEHQLLQTWFKLVLEKNKLERYESELMIFAQELELEDTQSQLQRDLRSRMAMDGNTLC
uniref:F-actin monooxygenase n=1 Tax=Denticeps clupeoides TaxID=299321 RepID=A0AAY4DCJ7_9TELE